MPAPSNEEKKKPGDEDESGLEMTIEAPAFHPLNTDKSVFDRDGEKRFGGINTRPSVFDR